MPDRLEAEDEVGPGVVEGRRVRPLEARPRVAPRRMGDRPRVGVQPEGLGGEERRVAGAKSFAARGVDDPRARVPRSEEGVALPVARLGQGIGGGRHHAPARPSERGGRSARRHSSCKAGRSFGLRPLGGGVGRRAAGWARRDSNPYVSRLWNLNPARLPVTPLALRNPSLGEGQGWGLV